MRALGAPGRALALPVDPRDCAHIQNTEATADQFLVEDGEPGFMIDWEKPIVGEVAQDVAYFLAPTSTIWQDGPILTPPNASGSSPITGMPSMGDSRAEASTRVSRRSR